MGTYFGNKKVKKVYLGNKLVSGGELNPFPVGSIYMSTNSTSPAEYYGGTWTQIAGGRTLMGAGAGTDVDGATKTIAANESKGSYGTQQHNHSATTTQTVQQGYKSADRSHYQPGRARFYNCLDTSTGTSENVQPYYGVYIWKRIS